MKNIVRSFNKDKDKGHASQSHPRAPAALQPTDMSKKMPPKGIVRAVESHSAASPQELSLQKGDFFHVLGETVRQGTEWFDVTNPLSSARGLVPKECCEVLGKTSAGAKSPGASPNAALFGMGDLAGALPAQRTPSPAMNNGFASPSAPQMQPSSSQNKGQSLYGRVQFDFDAQRPDELDAKRGENIIVIAQSNHEWFVAKPIGRLGGPGLIPVSYVEILNMATGKPLDASIVGEMVRGGALPPVEEWKKNTAEYKQRSIPLGRFDFPGQAGPAQPARQEQAAGSQRSHSSASRHQDGARDSYSSHRYPSNPSNPSMHRSQGSTAESYFGQTNGSDGGRGQYASGAARPSNQAQQLGLVCQASVDSFHQEEGSFWFLVRCAFTSGYSLILYRSYEDFYEFQMSLINDLPVEAGRELPAGARPQDQPKRIIPRLPGPVDRIDEVTCAQRQVDLTIYLDQLCRLPEYVRGHFRFFEFFLIRTGDLEVTQPHEEFGGLAQQEQAENEIVEYLDRMPGSKSISPDAYGPSYSEDLAGERGSYAANPPVSTSRPASGAEGMYANASGRSSRASNIASDPRSAGGPSYKSPGTGTDSVGSPWSGTQSMSSTQPAAQVSSAPPSAAAAPQAAPSFIKIKIFHRNTDDLIAIRVPPNVARQALLDKTRERLGNDVSRLRYREDIPPQERTSSTSARLVELFTDDDLASWLQSGRKMVLYVD